ncbi:hypothetical protein [Geosporobacter ferrireducens]|uniref:Uncharacterized protein n=1 Tax=Geosporobacter ferrireducens TaxID=1424294 RepID=A0A1D8GPS7_9FIRM|nr:hypothetical protein [Geosporobacter ferrireducens]AOT72919.1 hypothetical protein Gferi_27190 [Geosporobacter ferrireducens]MTI55326.1 hypothetical protein [Geosporobacter ferrireducens]
MSVGDYSVIFQLLTSFLIGIVIKLLDDYMDEELPQKLLSLEFKNAILPYSLILFSVAAALDTIYAVTLFSAAYILGMFFHMQQKLPTGFTALQESLIVLMVNLLIFSFRSILTSLLVIFFIQCIDDLMDRQWDKRMGHHNLANKFGVGEVAIFSVILSIIMIMLDMRKFVIVSFCFLFISSVYKKYLPSCRKFKN